MERITTPVRLYDPPEDDGSKLARVVMTAVRLSHDGT